MFLQVCEKFSKFARESSAYNVQELCQKLCIQESVWIAQSETSGDNMGISWMTAFNKVKSTTLQSQEIQAEPKKKCPMLKTAESVIQPFLPDPDNSCLYFGSSTS